MRIEKLRLKGWTGIKKGLGLDVIEVDFSGISGLVAFEGVNGSGKSTCLELMSPYPRLASRDGAFFHHVCRRDAERELTFSYGGHSYRTLIKVDCDSEKQEGFVWRDGVSEINGKISEYNKYIRNLLGSPDLFYASVFCGQNSAKLSDLTTGQLKSLFAEFLRLDRLTAYEETAKQCGNVLSGSIGQLEIRRNALNQIIDDKGHLLNKKATLDNAISDLHLRSNSLKHQAFMIQNRIDELKEVSAQNAVNLQRRQDIQATIERIQEDFTTGKATTYKELTDLRSEYAQLQNAMLPYDITLSLREAILAASEKENELGMLIDVLTAEIDALTTQGAAHIELIHSMENGVAGLRASLAALDNDQELSDMRDQERNVGQDIRGIEQLIKDIETDFQIMGLEAEIKSLEEKTSILELKDPACQSKTCSFITNSMQAEEALPGLRKELAACKVKQAENKAIAREKLDSLNDQLKNLTAKYEERMISISGEQGRISEQVLDGERDIKAKKELFEDRNKKIAESRAKLSSAKIELGQAKALAAKLPEIQVAEQRKADAEKRMSDVASKAQSIKSAFEQREIEHGKTIDDYQAQAAEIEKLIDNEADGKLIALQAEAAKIEKDQLPEIEKEIQESRDDLAAVQGDLARVEASENELMAVNSERERLAGEISEWAYLRNACSKNGLQALEIDGAAPLITGYANDLLSQAFGPLFTVRLRTQDDEGREVLDIVVILEDGSEVLLENLSGGQRVWVLMALRLAMTLLSKEKSGRNFETAFFDELDGALDPENSLNFIAMYQAFTKTGGFKMIPFISHKPECRSMADNVLQFQYGKNPVWG